MPGNDEHVNITITANADAALRELARVKQAVSDLQRATGGAIPGPSIPAGAGRSPIPAGAGASPLPRGALATPPGLPPTVPSALQSTLNEAHRRATASSGSGGGGAGSAVRQMATSGQSVALMLFPNASAGAEFLRAQGWSSSHLGTPQGIAQAGGIVGSTSAAGVHQARSTAQALRAASTSPILAALPQNAGGVPAEAFANLLATSGALPGPAGSAIRSIAARGAYGRASASDLQALQALKTATAPDLQAQVEKLRGQRATISANMSAGRYRTVGAQQGAQTQLGALDTKIGNLVAAMSTLDEATAAATAALAATGATGPRRSTAASSVASRASSVASSVFSVAKRTASALGPIAGIASLGFVGASVGSYWQMANEAGRAWARAGQQGTFSPYFSTLENQASQYGYTIPTASSALSAASLYSGNTSSALGQNAGVLQVARALGLDPQTAGQVLGQIAAYGPVTSTYGVAGPSTSGLQGSGVVNLNSALIGGRALASGLDPRQYLSALASITQTAGQSNANVSAAGTSALLSSAGMLANATGLSMFRGTRGASWLSQFQGATQQGLGGGAGEFITLQAIQSAYKATHGGTAAGNFHLMALQSAGPLGWGNRSMTSAYVNALWKKFQPMGAAGEALMAKSLGMSDSQFYSLMHHGGISAVTNALTSPVATSSVSAAAKNALGKAGGGAAGAAAAEAAMSALTAEIGGTLSPAVVKLTQGIAGLNNTIMKKLGTPGEILALLGLAAGPTVVKTTTSVLSRIAEGLGFGAAVRAAGGGAADLGALATDVDALATEVAPALAGGALATVAAPLAAAPIITAVGGHFVVPAITRHMEASAFSKLQKSHPAASLPSYISNRWGSTIQKAAQVSGVSPQIISAVMAQESWGDPGAISASGAEGLMQLMPATAAALGVKGNQIMNPLANVTAGAKYLAALSHRFAKYGPMATTLALAAYNAGPGAVTHDLATLQAEHKPITWADLAPLLPKQTQQYVPAVQGWENQFSAGGMAFHVQVIITPTGGNVNPS